MITIIGIIIFIIPFVFVRLFKDKVVGVLTILTASALMHMLIALMTQYLKIFNYQTIISLYVVIDLFILLVYYFKYHKVHRHNYADQNGVSHDKKEKKSPSRFKKILVILAFAVVFFNLFSVHYNFSGTVNTYKGEKEVAKSSYIYPYFSDEWIAIAFVNYSIDSGSLPIVNPMFIKRSFNNPLVPYFSFLSETFLFFGLDPLGDYEVLALLVGFSICILFFILLLSIGVSLEISALTILIIPYITNGGNLPGIWFLIPMIFSLAFYIISLIAFAKNDKRLLFLSTLFCLCLYPPFIAFVAPVLLALFFKNRKALIFSLGIISLVLIITGLIVFKSFNPRDIVESLKFYFFRKNLVGGILSFPIWIVLPRFVLPLAVLGLWIAFKKKLYFVIFPLFVGLIYWVSYIDTEKVFIIDFPRVVTITSFLVLIPFALFVNYLFGTLFKSNLLRNVLVTVSILFAIFISFDYTENESWRSLLMYLNRNQKARSSLPAPTASRFLTDEDLIAFSGFTKKTFISPAWKGLVISAATGNYPLATKPSTVGVFILNYNNFVNSNCKEKEKTSIKNNIDYVYSEEFDCPNFDREVGVSKSSEGLVLYKFTKPVVGQDLK